MYKTLLADPPWKETGGGKSKRGADAHYPLMSALEILDFLKNIDMEANSHCYIWVTNNHLPDGLWVIKELGFRYITNLVWIKNTPGLGQYFRGEHELCLFGVKGRLPYKKGVNSNRSICTEGTIIRAPKKEHSVKPNIYSKIEKISYPPFIEAFARFHIEGWDVIGNESPKEIQFTLKIYFSG